MWITDNQRHFNWNIIHCDIIPAIQLLFLCSFVEIMVTSIIILVVLLVIYLIFYNLKVLLIPVWCWIICVVVMKWRVPGYYYFICHTVSLKFEIRLLAIQMSKDAKKNFLMCVLQDPLKNNLEVKTPTLLSSASFSRQITEFKAT